MVGKSRQQPNKSQPPQPKKMRQPKNEKQSPNKAQQPPNESQQQPYDNLLKRLVEHQRDTIIPLLLGDNSITGIEELNVEMLLSIRRGDLIYRLYYKGEWHLLHFEFESSSNGKMDKHLHFYNAFLWYEYEQPVISILLYPFETSTVSPPMIQRDANGDIDTFHYKIIRTWDLDARQWISNKQAIPFYSLMPTMDHLSKEMLLQAIDDDETPKREELLCFKVML